MRCLYCNKRLGLFASKKRPFCSDLHEDWFRDEKAGIGIERLLNPFSRTAPQSAAPPALPAEEAPAETGKPEPEPLKAVSYLQSLPAQTDFVLKPGSLVPELDLRPAEPSSPAASPTGLDLAQAIVTPPTLIDAAAAKPRDEKAGIGIERLLNPFSQAAPQSAAPPVLPAEEAPAETGKPEPEPLKTVSYLQSLPAPAQTDFVLKPGLLVPEIDLRPAEPSSPAASPTGLDLAEAIVTPPTLIDAAVDAAANKPLYEFERAYGFERMAPQVCLVAGALEIAGEVGSGDPAQVEEPEAVPLQTDILPIPQTPPASGGRNLQQAAWGPSFDALRFSIERPLTSVAPRHAPVRWVPDAVALLPESLSLSRPLELLLTVLQSPKQARQSIPAFSDFKKSVGLLENLVLEEPARVSLRPPPSQFAALGWEDAVDQGAPRVPASVLVSREVAAGILTPRASWEKVPVAGLPAASARLHREPHKPGAFCQIDPGGIAVRETSLRQPAPAMDSGRPALQTAAGQEIEMAWQNAAEISFAVENSSPSIHLRMPEAASGSVRQELRWAELGIAWNEQRGVEREIESEGLRSEAKELQSPAAPAIGAFLRVSGLAYVEEKLVPIPAVRRALADAQPVESRFQNAFRYPVTARRPELQPGIAQAFSRFGRMQRPSGVSCPLAAVSDRTLSVVLPAASFEIPPLAPRQEMDAHAQWRLAPPAAGRLKLALFRDRPGRVRRPRLPDTLPPALAHRKTWKRTLGVGPKAEGAPFVALVSAGPQPFRSAAHIRFREPGLRAPGVGAMPGGKAALSTPFVRLDDSFYPNPAAIPLRPGLRYHSP